MSKKSIISKGIISIIIIISVFSLVSLALAQGSGSSGQLYNPFGGKKISGIIMDAIVLLIDLSIPLSVLMGIVAAFHFMTAGGNPQKIKQGIGALTGAVVGLGVVLLAHSIFGIIHTQIVGQTTLQGIINSIATYLQTIGGPLAILGFLWGAFLYSTGIPSKIKKAYPIFIWSSVGAVIILAVKSIEVFVRYFLTP